MAENNNYLRDAFGKSSDWIELQNTTGRPVNLDGWSLTDNISLPAKWIIPSVTLPPWGTLLIWASGSDLRDPAGELHTNFSLSKSGEYLGLYDADRTLVYDFGSAFPPQYENITYGTAFTVLTNSAVLVSNTSPVRAHCPPSAALGTTWRQLAFDDSTWAAGILPAGYATKNPAWLPQINFSLQGIAQGKPGVYLRIPFALDDASAVTALTYGMSYDDGAAVFINGTHACSANAPDVAALTYSSYSVAILNDPATLSPSNITAAATALADGPNVLAVHLMNCNASSSDLFLKPLLTATLKTLHPEDAPTFLAAATPGTLNGDASTQRLPQRVTFSMPQGIFTAPFTLTLGGTLAGQTIRYTTNGAEPATTNGTLYTAPFTVSSSRHIRARVFDAVGRSGETSTAQYTFAATDSATLNFATAMPILILRETDPTTNGIPAVESTNYTACAAHLIEPVSGTACLTSAPALTCRAGIHVRGSSSSGFAKKPYALTFWGEDNDDSKVALAGFPKGSDFALISCYNYDRTYMHDALLFSLSRQAGRYAPCTRFVELFTIGNDADPLTAARYAGLYVLEERIKAGNDRVPIDDIVSPAATAHPALSGSYLFKADRADADEFSWRTARNFPSSDGRYMVLAYPKIYSVQPEQTNYIVAAFNAFENTINGANPMHPETGIARHIDTLSFVDFHMFKMFSMDVDIFTLSSWFHKDRSGKIMAGPLWDFDRSLGPYGYNETSYPNVKRWDAWTFASEPFTRGDFWGRLHAQPAFRRLYWDRWFELRKSVFSETNLVATITALKALIPEAAAERDIAKWNQRPNQQFGTTHASEIQWLTWFVTNRVNWIDQAHTNKSLLLNAPVLSPASGVHPPGHTLYVTLTAAEGNHIYYTLDGTDPARWDNQPTPSALHCTSGTTLTLTATTLLFARTYRTSDSRWGLAARGEYLIGARHAQPGDIRISEIHYNPENGDPAVLPELISRCYEFVELLNTADCDISLTGCRFPEGQPADALTLGPLILRPGTHAVVARHSEAFASRYGTSVTPVAYWLYNGLSDSGETVTLLNREGAILDALTYKTSGEWPKSADGTGDSLNRSSFSFPVNNTPWKAAPPTPGRGGHWEWLGLRGILSLDGDDDGDGVPNLIEYYTGADPLDPTDRGRSALSCGHTPGTGLSVSFTQALDRPDARATLHASEDLLEWTELDTSVLESEQDGNARRWTLRLSPQAQSDYPRRYFRLRVWPATSSGGNGDT